jgi:hypothetical protein
MTDQTPRYVTDQTPPYMAGQAPQPGQPPRYDAPAPYQAVSVDQRAIWRSKGQRYIAFGALWLAVGLIITVVTYAQAAGGGVYIVAWGPMLYGAYRIIRGVLLLRQAQ